ncbi:hypothetical protein DYB32_007289 [Aphanomyces invadans]|uniref:Major facilitator superfamily (MFS) profile domain-containing protein n=1 Tax=Aphanomyces invadans TaxID=157072 RepID=A0A418AP99_9STRA|nr:hypothetical protein DYB32_007289 [Aphanomyces invadans]
MVLFVSVILSPSRSVLVGNLGARLATPLLSDLITRVCYANPAFAREPLVFVGLLVLQFVALVLVLHNFDNPVMVQRLASVLTSAAGGGLAIIPCFVTDKFGVYNSGTMYGVVWTSWSCGAVVSGYLLSKQFFSMAAVSDQLRWMLILTGTGIGLMMFVRTNSMDRFFHGDQFRAFGKVLVQVPFRVPPRGTVDNDDADSLVTMVTPVSQHAGRSVGNFVVWSAEDIYGKIDVESKR